MASASSGQRYRGALRGALADANKTRNSQTHAYRPRKIKTHQREFIRVLGREERVSVIAEESSPRGAYDASTFVLHRCGGCRWMPPLERLLNASRVANGVDDASAAEALVAVWETRVLATFKY